MKQLDQKLRDLVVANLDVAEITAHRFAGLGRSRGVEEDDLRQEAYYGLCVAALKYDATKGARFRTVAFQWCRKMVERTSLPALPFEAADKVATFFSFA